MKFKEPYPIWFFLFWAGLAGVFVSGANAQRQIAVWTYANSPEKYSQETFDIESARLFHLGKGDYRWMLHGQINGQKIATEQYRLRIPRAVLEDLQKKDLPVYRMPVLFAPSLVGDQENHYAVHVLEPAMQGTTLADAIVEIILWNVFWVVCGITALVTFVSNSIRWRRAYRETEELCRIMNERRRSKRKR